jgi:predicted TIM-barrel fold metal-dependent hydrolase
MQQNVAKFNTLPLSVATKQKILHDNAAQLFPR